MSTISVKAVKRRLRATLWGRIVDGKPATSAKHRLRGSFDPLIHIMRLQSAVPTERAYLTLLTALAHLFMGPLEYSCPPLITFTVERSLEAISERPSQS